MRYSHTYLDIQDVMANGGFSLVFREIVYNEV